MEGVHHRDDEGVRSWKGNIRGIKAFYLNPATTYLGDAGMVAHLDCSVTRRLRLTKALLHDQLLGVEQRNIFYILQQVLYSLP